MSYNYRIKTYGHEIERKIFNQKLKVGNKVFNNVTMNGLQLNYIFCDGCDTELNDHLQ